MVIRNHLEDYSFVIGLYMRNRTTHAFWILIAKIYKADLYAWRFHQATHTLSRSSKNFKKTKKKQREENSERRLEEMEYHNAIKHLVLIVTISLYSVTSAPLTTSLPSQASTPTPEGKASLVWNTLKRNLLAIYVIHSTFASLLSW